MPFKTPKSPWVIFAFLMVIVVWIPVWFMTGVFARWLQAAIPSSFVAAAFFTVGLDAGTKSGFQRAYEAVAKQAGLMGSADGQAQRVDAQSGQPRGR